MRTRTYYRRTNAAEQAVGGSIRWALTPKAPAGWKQRPAWIRALPWIVAAITVIAVLL
jgi:hypothetical protein